MDDGLAVPDDDGVATPDDGLAVADDGGKADTVAVGGAAVVACDDAGLAAGRVGVGPGCAVTEGIEIDDVGQPEGDGEAVESLDDAEADPDADAWADAGWVPAGTRVVLMVSHWPSGSW